MALNPKFLDPPRKFSVMPLWFWNDALDEAELLRQIAEMESHGVYGFVIHPRVGLPREIGWMSERMLDLMRVAIAEARRRAMAVVLYDEGMYPSGSASGQVVAADPAYRCRCLALAKSERLEDPTHHLVADVKRANGQRVIVVDRPVDSVIRGLHYLNENRPHIKLAEETPPAADILNPDAVATFIHLVYDRYAEALGDYFGDTIFAIFTDEPGLLGRPRERNVWPGTTGILEHVNAFLGYDFTPHLPALWYDDEPDATRYRRDYSRAIAHRLSETFYTQLHDWCERHAIALAGHPGSGDDMGYLRYFHIPGQDLVWRWVLPGPTAIEGAESTQAKGASSAAQHLRRQRNSNECFGAYGHQFTWDEMLWLVNWCFVRGTNLLYPHAFYYSIRGPRKDERPPDVGPHSPWWGRYRDFADYCRRLCWLNAESRHDCHIAILCEDIGLPWPAAKVCFQNQRDFNYLELRHLWEDAHVNEYGIAIAGMCYTAVIMDGLKAIPPEAQPALRKLVRSGRVILWSAGRVTGPIAGLPSDPIKIAHTPEALLAALERLVPPDLTATPPAPDLRYRHVVQTGDEGQTIHSYLLANEGVAPLQTVITVSASGEKTWIDPFTLETTPADDPLVLNLEPYTLRILQVQK
ncbi:MAG: hypothetical protein JXA21_04800 [Anaerolineae bacterium]|nr:hypothetical protein [Anaerolineae bacterium]